MAITSFRKEYFFLSNFYKTNFIYNGIAYTTSEAAFQAQKTLDRNEHLRISKMSPDDSKKAGRSLALREDWEEVKDQVMYDVLVAKFTQNAELREKLIATGNEELVEGNDWNDKYWGVCNGVGKNQLGKTLMRIRSEMIYLVSLKNDIVDWIKKYFVDNAYPTAKAIIGISGGKDSSVAAALCAEALGKDRVVGVVMPQGIQEDINYSYQLIDFLGIQKYEVNILNAVNGVLNAINFSGLDITEQAKINTPARIRMTTLYAVAACIGGRIVNTCNLSEDYVGYSTKFGDSAGDFSPFANIPATVVVKLGDIMGLPYELTHKTPIDGLCGKTDEENLGFSYQTLDNYLLGVEKPSNELVEKIETMHKRNLHKLEPMPKFEP